MYRRFPEYLTEPPPEGPNSGYLVLFDEEAETTTCFGLCKSGSIEELPFPQNKDLTITYQAGENYYVNYDVLFIPVLNKPLSSNQYYVIRRKEKNKGYVFFMNECIFYFPHVYIVFPLFIIREYLH